jgi:MbtH protein
VAARRTGRGQARRRSYGLTDFVGAYLRCRWSLPVDRSAEHSRWSEMPLWNNYDNITFQVVANSASQLSIWPAIRPRPHGWAAIGFSGSQRECLDFIDGAPVNGSPADSRARADAAGRAADGAFNRPAAACGGHRRAFRPHSPSSPHVDNVPDKGSGTGAGTPGGDVRLRTADAR